MNRNQFIKNVSLAGAGWAFQKVSFAQTFSPFPVVRTPLDKRKFHSTAIEAAIAQFQKEVKNKELAWLFENCFPNTLDTTVDFELVNGKPDTYVITGDIDAMWLRDSTAQVWPYLQFIKEDNDLQQLLAGVINRQTRNILKDPYANAFYKDATKESEWKSDLTKMQPGIHERKWEIDSLCYPVRLAHGYWKTVGDASVFDEPWHSAARAIVRTFREQQRKTGPGPYSFKRKTTTPNDTLNLNGYGNPVKAVGLIASGFRPSDDACIYPFLIPSNRFAVRSLRQLSEIATNVYHDAALALECDGLAQEVSIAIDNFGTAKHPQFGTVYAYEVDGFGNQLFMDDANVPSLLCLPYLGLSGQGTPIYRNTRHMVLSDLNPYFFRGKVAEGIGGPHIGKNMVWPLAIIMRGMTSTDRAEVTSCLRTLVATDAGTGFMHESFDKDDPSRFTRDWFAWANTLFGEFVLKVRREDPEALRRL
jgi:meiotically up-regulated gene 157 (Mug157) protein